MSLIKPQVYGQIVTEKITGKVRVLNLATELENIGEYATVGKRINFPKFSYIGSSTPLVRGDAIVPVELAQTNSYADIKHFAKGVSVFDVDVYTATGGSRMINESANQIATSIARTLDDDLITTMKTDAVLKYSTIANGKKITQEELLGALGLFGDERDVSEFAGIVINSLLIDSFYGMSLFVDVTKTTAMSGNGVIENGLIGFFCGIPCFISDKGTLNGLNCTTFVIKKNSLGYKLKAKGVDIEEQRDASKKKTDIFGDILFCTHLIDESGVVVIEKA